MKIVSVRGLIVLLLVVVTRVAVASELTGAGSTFVYPLMAKWASSYRAATGHVVNYQSIGSGGGIQQIENRTVDFGATDMPLASEDLRRRGLAQFPLVAGAVVPVVHVAGVADHAMKLSGAVLADVYLGVITRWNDPRLRALNPNLDLPDRLITVVHRADGSGTSYIWTSYLSAASPAWRSKVGQATALTWPVGVGGKGNEGVASFVKHIDGAIGYVESAFATRARMTTARLENAAGQFVTAEAPAFAAALVSVDWTRKPDYDVTLVNAGGVASWPITGATFILMRRTPVDVDQSNAALAFFAWAYREGAASAADLHYVPLPRTLCQRVAAEWPARIHP